MEITKAIDSLGNLTPSIAMAVIFGLLYLNIMKQMDKAEDRRDEKDAAFMKFMAETIKQLAEFSEQLHETAKINAEANQKIIDKFGEIQCLKPPKK